jgi:hypothetical protein
VDEGKHLARMTNEGRVCKWKCKVRVYVCTNGKFTWEGRGELESDVRRQSTGEVAVGPCSVTD